MSSELSSPGGPPAGPPPPGPPPKGPPPGPPPKGPPPGPPPGVPALNLKGKAPIVVKDASGTVVRSSEEKWDREGKLTAADKIEHDEEEKKKKARAARFRVCTKGKCFEFLIFIGLATYFVVTFVMVFRHISYSYSWISFDVFDNSDCDGEPTHTNLIFGSPGQCQRYDGPMVLTATQGFDGDNNGEEYYSFRCLNGDQTADFSTYSCRDTCFWHEKSWEAYGVDGNDESKWHCPIDWNQQPLNDAAVDYENPKISKCYKMHLFLQKSWDEDFSEYKVLTNKSQVTRYYEYFDYMDTKGKERDEPLNVPACSFQEKDVLDFVDTSGEGGDDDEDDEDDEEEDDERRRRRIMHYVAESTHRARTEGITVWEAKQVQKLRRIVSHPDPLTRRRRLTTDMDMGYGDDMDMGGDYDTDTSGGTGDYTDTNTSGGTSNMDMDMGTDSGMTYAADDICSSPSMFYDEPMCTANPDCQWCMDKSECGVTCEFDACNYWDTQDPCNDDALCSWENGKCSSSYSADDFLGCDMNLDLFKTVASAIMSRNGDWHWEMRVWWDWDNVPINYKKETCAREAPFSSECVWMEADEECVSIESAMSAIPWDEYAVENILCSFSPDCLSWQNGPMKQCEQDYGWEICNGCSNGQCSGFDELLREHAGDTMDGTDLSCSQRDMESWEMDDEENKGEQTCIPMQGDDDITFDSICIDGVMYSDHFCNTSIMGMMVLIGMMAAGFVGTCALRLFALPLFLRCFKVCCKCCFHEDDHVKGAFTHVAQAKKKLVRKNTLGK